MRQSIHHINLEHPGASRPRNATKIKKLINWILTAEKAKGLWAINVVFVDDAFLSHLNRCYFLLDQPTDVITFNLSDASDDSREGEIYVSIERARLQAKEYSVSLENEVLRLVAHGMYHLLDYDDATEAEKKRMSKLEDQAIVAVSKPG